MEKLNVVKATKTELAKLPEADLASKINDAHNRFVGGLKTSLEVAYEAGMFLHEVKGRLGHGKFNNWIKENCRFQKRQANNYMDVFSNWKTVEEKWRTAGKLSIQKALDELREAKGTKGKRKKATSTTTESGTTTSNTSTAIAPASVRLFTESSGMEAGETSVPRGERASGFTADDARMESRMEDADATAKGIEIKRPERLVERLAEFGVTLHQEQVPGMVRFLLFMGIQADDVAALVN